MINNKKGNDMTDNNEFNIGINFISKEKVINFPEIKLVSTGNRNKQGEYNHSLEIIGSVDDGISEFASTILNKLRDMGITSYSSMK